MQRRADSTHASGERRHDARFRHGRVAELRATIRPGWPATIVDLSAGGVLIDAPRPLRPGARVYLQVTDASTQAVFAAHVLRCTVATVDPERGVRYRAALRFEQPCRLVGEHRTRDGSPVPEPGASAGRRVGTRYPSTGSMPAAPREDTLK